MGLTIKESIQQIVRNEEEIYSLIATVTEVDEGKRTITAEPIDGSAEVFDVKLQANESGETGIVSIPTVDSQVVITFLSKDTAFVSLCTDVDKIIIDTEEITINGGDNGGTTNTPALRTELNKTIARITALEASIAAFATAQGNVAVAVPLFIPLAPGWSALGTAVGALPIQGAYNTNIEDTKITH